MNTRAGSVWGARSHRISRRGALVIGGMAAFLAACGSDDKETAKPAATTGAGGATTGGAATAAPGGGGGAAQARVGGTWRYPMYGISSQNPPTIFPFENLSYLAQTPGAFIYSRLLRSTSGADIAPTDHTKLEGDLASALPEQPDPLTYVFKLKPNITYHDKPPMNGRAANAQDFAKTWEYFKTKSQNAGAYNSVVDKVEAVDAQTVKFTLKSPFAPFLTTHASSPEGVWLIPVETIDNGQAQKDPVGTGPWVFRQWETGVAIRFDRHPKYHDSPLPYYAKLEGGLVGDPQRIVAGLQAGDLDASGLSVTLYEDAKKKLDPKGKELFVPTGVLSGFIFNFDIKPWADKRVRQALSYALDRDGYLKVQDQTGKGDWHSFISPALTPYYMSPKTAEAEFGPNARYFKKNIAEAKKLLEAAGVQTPLRFKLYCNVDAYGAEAKQAWELFAQTIPEAGFQPELVFQEYGTWIQSSYLAKFPDMASSVGVSPLIGAPRDPDDIFFRNFASVSARKNWGGTPPAEMADLDARFAKQRTLLKLEDRVKEIKEIQRVMSEFFLTVPTHGSPGYGYVQPWVQNYNDKSGYGNPMESIAKSYFTDDRIKKG